MATITGTNGGDVITPDDETNGVTGGFPSDVADVILGRNGEDFLDGGGGNDTIDGENGNDTVIGGDGDDVIDNSNAAGADSLVGGAGNDTLYAYQGDTIDAGSGDDLLRVWADQNFLFGGSGTDRLNIETSYWLTGSFSLATNSIEVIRGNGLGIRGTNSGDDILDFTGVTLISVTDVDGQGGNDVIQGIAGAASIGGGAGNDSLVGGGNNDTLEGDGGNDTIIGGAGDDQIDLSSGSNGGDDSLAGGDGNDTFFAYQNDTIDGGAGNDLIRVYSDQAYNLQGGAGTDTVEIQQSYWIAGSFRLSTNGIEIIKGNGNGVRGTGGDDEMVFLNITLDNVAYIDGQGGNDTLRAFADDVRLFGGAGNDSLNGSAGEDVINGGSGNDTLNGGNGNDTIDATTSDAQGDDYIDAGGGNDVIFAYGNDTIIAGTANDIIYVWSDYAYQILGGYGFDRIFIQNNYWYTGNFSRAVNDIEEIHGNYGTIRGTAGDDSLDFSNIALLQVAAIEGQNGNDTIQGVDVVMNIAGNAGNDSLVGSGFDDTMSGGTGNDTVLGGAGNDLIDQTTSDASGNDLISGGDGNDTILAYQNDTIDAGDGNDLINVWSDTVYQLQGGAGTDTVSIISSYWFVDGFGSGNGIEVIQGNAHGIYGTNSGNDNLNFSGVTLDNVAFIDGQGGNDTIRGFSSAISVNGGSGNDSIVGGNFDDTLIGSSGNDTVTGNGGDDIIDQNTSGASGNDLLDGGGGNDTLFAYGADTIDAGSGNDLIQVWSDQIYQLQGGSGTDTLEIVSSYWNTGSFSLLGNGIEIIDGNGKAIYGDNASNDVLNFAGIVLDNVDFIAGQGGNDTITGFTDSIELFGGAGNDSLVGGAGNDTLNGDSGNDTLNGGDGDDYLRDSSGTDNYVGGNGNDTIDFSSSGSAGTMTLGSGNTSIGGASENFTSIEHVIGSQGANTITGTGGDNYIDGQSGNDSLSGGAGNDTILGGFGTDTMNGGTGIDWVDFSTSSNSVGANIDLGAGTASLGATVESIVAFENVVGTQYADTITGSGVANILDGGAGNDSINGIGNDDTLIGGLGNDTLNGGSGTDTADYSYALGGVIDLNLGSATIASNDIDSLINIVNVIGTQGRDTIAGNGSDNILDGGLSRDYITGGGGNDTIFGGASDDTMDGQGGVDSLVGGAGNDTYIKDATNDTFVELAGGGTDEVLSSVSYALGNGSNIENLTLTGTAANGTGNELDNTLTGNGSNNSLSGGNGDDTLIGGNGSDTLLGGNDDDRLIGGTGDDSMDGQGGTDLIVYTAGAFGAGDLANGTFDTIAGGVGDSIDFTTAINGLLQYAGTVLGASGTDVVIGGAAFSAGTSNIRFLNGTDLLQIDLDQNGSFNAATDFQISLPGVNSVTYDAAQDLFILG